MSSPSQESATGSPRWTLSGSEAVADQGTTTLNLAAAAAGVRLGEGIEVLGVDVPAGSRPGEAWARGHDLTAVYEPSDPRQLRITAMWRLGTTPANADVQTCTLILSAQTSRLCSKAELTVLARVAAVSGQHAGVWDNGTCSWQAGAEPGCRSLRLSHHAGQSPRNLLITIHPNDAGILEAATTADGTTSIRCRLFPSDVEKGVLLRSRVLVALGPAVVPHEGSSDWTTSVMQEFAASEPILAT